MKKATQQITVLNGYTLSSKDASKMSDEALVARRDELKAIIKEANEILDSAIDPELFERADRYNEREFGVENRTVMIIERPNFNFVPLSFARRKKAIKEVVNSEVLKPLWKKGTQIPGVKITEFVTVK